MHFHCEAVKTNIGDKVYISFTKYMISMLFSYIHFKYLIVPYYFFFSQFYLYSQNYHLKLSIDIFKLLK